jgi:hypothetical protein
MGGAYPLGASQRGTHDDVSKTPPHLYSLGQYFQPTLSYAENFDQKKNRHGENQTERH